MHAQENPISQKGEPMGCCLAILRMITSWIASFSQLLASLLSLHISLEELLRSLLQTVMHPVVRPASSFMHTVNVTCSRTKRSLSTVCVASTPTLRIVGLSMRRCGLLSQQFLLEGVGLVDRSTLYPRSNHEDTIIIFKP